MEQLATVPLNDMLAILRLLRYSWEPVGFDYSGLTEEERKLVDRPTFERLVQLTKDTTRAAP